MNCELCTENLTAYLDSELTPRESDDVRRHIETCLTCRSELEDLRESMQFVEVRVKQLDPSPLLWRNVQARITQLPAPRPRLGDLFRMRWAPVALAASIALAAGLGMWGYLDRQNRQTAEQYAIEQYMDAYIRLRDGEEQTHRAPRAPGRLLALHEEFSENPFVNVAEQSPPNPFVIDGGRSEGTR